MKSTRIENCFTECASQGRPALVTFITAGDPDLETSQAIMDGLPGAGADLIELGLPFSDPMADGPVVEAAGHRALAAGHTLQKSLDMVASFRTHNSSTPVILMGYYNPIYQWGAKKFVTDARAVGVDGLIIVDLPPEEDKELCLPALEAGLNFIRLTTPTTDAKRLPVVLKNTSGFVYYVSMKGITGGAIANHQAVGEAVKSIKSHTKLPVAVGFGIKTAQDAALIGRDADGVVVGSALISALVDSLEGGRATPKTPEAVHSLVRSLAGGIARARA